MIRSFFIYFSIISAGLGYAFLVSQTRFRLSAGVIYSCSFILASMFIFLVGLRDNVGEMSGYENYFEIALNHGTESLAFLEVGFLWLLEFATFLSKDSTVLFVIFASIVEQDHKKAISLISGYELKYYIDFYARLQSDLEF